MGKSIKINYLYNLMYEILAIIIPLFTIPYISRVLGATAIGDYNYIYGILSFFGLVAATGTSQYSQREIAVLQNDKTQRSLLFWEIFLFRLISTVFVLLIYMVFIYFLLQQYKLLFFIHFLTIISWIVDISWYFQGVEEFKIIAIRNSIVKVVGTILIFIFVRTENDLYIYTLIIAVTTLLGNATMWFYISKEIGFVKFSSIKLHHHIKGILELFIPVIAIQLYTVFDKTMLGALCDTTQVGYYSQAENIVKIALTCISALFAVLLPRLTVIYRSGSFRQLNEYYSKALNFVFLLALPMTVGCILISNIFVPIFFGEGYEPVAKLLKIESILFVILGLGRLYGNFLVSMNRQNKYTISVTCAAIINIILNYFLIVVCDAGAYGVAIASVMAETVSTGLQLYFLKDVLSVKPILKSALKYFPTSILMGGVIIVVLKFSSGFTALLLSIIFAVLTYLILLLIRRDVQIVSVINQLKR